MTLSSDARWLLDHVAGASKGADGKILEAGAKAKALQELLDMELVKPNEKGRYWLTKLGQSEISGGAW